MPWTREKKIFCPTTYLETKSFKTVLNYMQTINMIMIHYLDKKLKKRLHVLKADINNNYKNIDLMSLAQRMHFLQAMFQMAAFALVLAINHYHINGLYLF